MKDRLPPLPDISADPQVRLAKARLAVSDMSARASMVVSAEALGHGGAWAGARPPVGPARPRAHYLELEELRGDDRVERLTPIGYRTARVGLPRVLAQLPSQDVRLQVALRYQDVAEKVGAVGGAEFLGGGARGRLSDGGAVHRTAMAAQLRALVGWLVRHDLVVLPSTNPAARRSVGQRALVDGVVLGGLEVKGVLRAHGWSGKGLYVRMLSEGLLNALSGMAEAC